MSSPGNAPSGKVKRFRTKFSDTQLSTLKDFYGHDNHPRRTELEDLASRLDLEYSVVKQWFDNKRHRDRPSSNGSSQSSHTPGGSGRGVPRGNGRDPQQQRSPQFPPVFHGRHQASGGRASSSSAAAAAGGGSSNQSYKGEDELDCYPPAKRDYPSQLDYTSPLASYGGGGDSSAVTSSASSPVMMAHGTSCSSVMGTVEHLTAVATDVAYPIHTTLSSTGPKRVPIDKMALKTEGKRTPHLQQPTYFQRLDSEPMEYYEEANEVLHPMPRNTSYDKKDFIGTLMPQFLSLIERRKSAHGEVDYPSFVVEAQKLLESLTYISETRIEQGNNIERNNTFKCGSISFPARPPESRDIQAEANSKLQSVEISYLHEAKEEGTVETSGRQIATQRLIMCHFDDTQSLVCEVGIKARGTSISLDPICQCQSDVFPQHPNRIHNLGDTCTTYRAWGNVDKLRSVIDTNLNSRELLSFLIFIISPLLHGAHWMNICMRQFFPAGTPHYYDVVEGLT
ncbi:uncharacterized protein LOC135819930 [Sycon ciliatum]|uniref:uncharacterized protein LOC135819930 n=1 Tax=Sycon ciliatum TaxID=27933 RepID=UPI0031F6C4AA